MPCVQIGDALVNMGNPTETVTMMSGRVLKVEWGDYFGPAVVTRTGLRGLTNAEFHDPNVDAWIVSHGSQSCLEDKGPLLPKPRKIVHRCGIIDREGNSSVICFAKPRAIDLSRENVTIRDDAVTCAKCKSKLALRRLSR